MKVIILADAGSSHTLKWVRSLIDKGLDIILFSLYANVEPGLNELLSEGKLKLSLGDKDYTGSYLDAKFLKRCLQLRKLIKDSEPDILHAHYASSYGLLGATARFHPYLISAWGSDVYSFPRKRWIFERVLRFNLASSDLILSSSQVMKEEVQLYTDKEVKVLPFGVDIEVFKPKRGTDKKTITIGTIKRMAPIYGIDILIKAFAILVKDERLDADIRLRLVGGGQQTDELKKLVKEKGIDTEVEFVGEIAHKSVPDELAKLDIYVALSREESFGVAILEALSCEIPVVVSDAPGPMEIVKGKDCGYIVPREDFEEAAERLKPLILNEDKRREMGLNGRKLVLDKYQWAKCVDLQVDIYNLSVAN